jgi:hypothetical protein
LGLNVETTADGTVQVEIQDESGTAIKGFTSHDADKITGNHIRKVTTWNGSSNVTALVNRPVRLRFIVSDTKLFSFQFVAD